MKFNLIKYIFIFCILNSKVWAQSDLNLTCINNLSKANNLYEKGQFEEAIDVLEPCVLAGNLKDNLTLAYRMLGLCYHQLGNEAKTFEMVLELLKSNPKYQLFPYNDPKDFSKIINLFTVQNKLNIGIKTGLNYSFPHMIKTYSIKPATIKIEGKSNQFLGLNADYFFKGNLLAFSVWTTSGMLTFEEQVTFNEFEKIKFKEELKLIDLGFVLRYYPLKKNKIRPFVGMGFNTLFVRSGLSNIYYSNTFSNIVIESSRDMKVEEAINTNLFYSIFDIGLNTKAGKGFLGLGLQYARAFSESNKKENRYKNIEFNIQNQWVDSDVKINYLNIYATYSFPILWRVYK